MDFQIFFSYYYDPDDLLDETKDKVLKVQRRLHASKRWKIWCNIVKLNYGSLEYACLHHALITSQVFICFLNEKYFQSTYSMKELVTAYRLKKTIVAYLVEKVSLDRLKETVGLAISDIVCINGYHDDNKTYGYNSNFKKLLRSVSSVLDHSQVDENEEIEIPKKIFVRIVEEKVEIKTEPKKAAMGCCAKKNSAVVVPDESTSNEKATNNLDINLKDVLVKVHKSYEDLLMNIDNFKEVDFRNIDSKVPISNNETKREKDLTRLEMIQEEMNKIEALEKEINEAAERSKYLPEKEYSPNQIKFPDNEKIRLYDFLKYTLDTKQYYTRIILDSKLHIRDQHSFEQNVETWKNEVIKLLESDKTIVENKMDAIAEQRSLYSDNELERLNERLEEKDKHFKEVSKFGDINKQSTELNKKIDDHLEEKKNIKKLVEELAVELNKPEKYSEVDRQLRALYKVEYDKFTALTKTLDEANAFKKQIEVEKQSLVDQNLQPNTDLDDPTATNSSIFDAQKLEHFESNISSISKEIEAIELKVKEQKIKLQKVEHEIEKNNESKTKRLEQFKQVEDGKKRYQELNIILNKLLAEKKTIDALLKQTKEFNDKQIEYENMKRFVDNVKYLTDEYKSLFHESKIITDRIESLKLIKFTHYHVVVESAKGKNTKPNGIVLIQMFATNNSETAKLELNDKNCMIKTRKPFTSDDIDEFNVYLTEIETINRIKVFYYGDDNQPDGWQLEKITIKAIPEITFPVYRLLNKNFGDCKSVLELIPDQQPEKPLDDNSYEISVYMKNKLDSDEKIDLFVQLFGDEGRTTKMLLNIEIQTFSDETKRDALSIKQFKNYSISEITMISVKCRENHNIFIDHITVRVFPYKLYKFNFSRWLSKNIADMRTSFMIYANVEKPVPPRKTNYSIAIHIADKKDSNLSLPLYLKIFGKQFVTEKLLLTGKIKRPLLAKIPNVFMLTGYDVEEIEKVKIFKDKIDKNSGIFIEKLVVNEKEFPFNCWLHDTVGKCLKELDSSDVQQLEEPKKIEYKLAVSTGRKTNESSEDEFMVKIYGKEANTEMHSIDHSFSENKTKEISLYGGYNVGEVESIEVIFNHKNKNSWFIEKFSLYVPSNNNIYEFPCYCWFSRLNESLTLKPSEKPIIKTEKTKYMLKVYMNKRKLESTDGNICLEIYGDCGIAEIDKDLNSNKLMCKEKENIFNVECFDFGLIQKIFVKFDNESDTHCYLEKVIINDAANNDHQFLFDRWFSSVIGDKKTGTFSSIEDRTEEKRDSELRKIQYSITIITKPVELRGMEDLQPDSKIYLRFFGDFVNSEKIDISKNKYGEIPFSKPAWYFVQVYNYDVGTIKKIEIYFNENDKIINFIDTLYISIFHRKPAYRFDFNRIDLSKYKMKIPLEPHSLIGETDKIKYVICIESDIKIESTDSKQFFVKIIGSNGSLPRHELKMPDRRFLTDNQYKFTLMHTNIGDIEHILFSTHFNTLFNSSWRLMRLSLQIPELAFNREFSVEGGYLLNNRTKDDKINFTVK